MVTGAMTSDQAILEDRARARSLKQKVLASAARLENAGGWDASRHADRPESSRVPEEQVRENIDNAA